MATGRSRKSPSRFQRLRSKRNDNWRRELDRSLRIESLEARQLLAVGPQIIGVQPNNGEILHDGDIRNVAPREIKITLNEGQVVDTATLGAIEITRSGGDFHFDVATARTDFNTNGAAVVEFRALASGSHGNDITLVFSKSDRGAGAGPEITVENKLIVVELNTNRVGRTNVLQLVNSLQAHPEARALIDTVLLSGRSDTDITTPAITYSPVNLEGANSAKVSTNFNSPTAMEIRFTAVTPGADGNGLTVEFTKSDKGGAGPPTITVVNNRTVRVNLNSNPGNETTPEQLVSVFNAHPQASTIMRAAHLVGNPAARLGAFNLGFSPLTLRGANDVVVTPGYIGLGDSAREIIFRFAEPPPDDLYRIDIDGTGINALRNADGVPLGDTADDMVDNGRDFSLEFELDLPAQILSVVPQPVVRTSNGVLAQAMNQIEVYFNNDDLDPAFATDPAFYQLVATRDTATNADDVVFRPFAVQYFATSDRATLLFSKSLHELVSNPGAFRLRIGTDEVLASAANPMPPTLVDLGGVEPGSSFNTAADLTMLDGSQIVSSAIEPQVFTLDFPGGNNEPGHRAISAQIESHLAAAADAVSGISTLYYNFRADYGSAPNGSQLPNLISAEQKQRAREIFEIYGRELGVQFVETATQGFTIATGDMRTIDPAVLTGAGGVTGIAGVSRLNNQPMVVLDQAEDWYDGFGQSDDPLRVSWFEKAIQEVGQLLGLGHTFDLPPGTVMGSEGDLLFDNGVEPVYPGDHDVAHGRHLHRVEGKDIDLYRFEITDTGLFTAETFAERRENSSLLDTALTLYHQDQFGVRTLLARNDDYFSNDSYIEMELEPGIYYVGVSAAGNESYDPTIMDSGIGGTTEGEYDLRLTFRGDADRGIFDLDNANNPNVASTSVSARTALDGDGDGIAGGVFNFWFRTDATPIFVDKASTQSQQNGSLAFPYRNISDALAVAAPGDIVRIVGNGGADGLLSTPEDAKPYQLGFSASTNSPLEDGAMLHIPKGVTVQIDRGAVFKMRRSAIIAGSTSTGPANDRSGGALQVFGTPRLLNLAGQTLLDVDGNEIPGTVYFTSIDDDSLGGDSTPFDNALPSSGDHFGGLLFKNDIDRAAGRFDFERQGIFLNHVNNAEIRYGGGTVMINSQPLTVSPVHAVDARPTITRNTITLSADSAMSANPDSFEETNFHAPEYQTVPFTSDYTRVGPDIRGNRIFGNSVNGLFIRTATPAGAALDEMTVSGRFDDIDIVHVIAETVRIQGSPGGPVQSVTAPNANPVALAAAGPDGTLAADTFRYKITFVDAEGREGPPSDATASVLVDGENHRSVQLSNLPVPTGLWVGRRIYRAAKSEFVLVVEQLNSPTSRTYLDDGSTAGGLLRPQPTFLDARLHGRLAIDPGTVVKFSGAGIETRFGSQLIAEGHDGAEVIFTSIRDDRYGAGGTFETNNNPDPAVGGDWSGLYIGQRSSASIDHAVFAFGGGVFEVPGALAGFNVLEIHQADARITNSVFQRNAFGTGGQSTPNRGGRGYNSEATIFVRGSQPVIVGNTFLNNDGPVISVNANALNSDLVTDLGRSRGAVEAFDEIIDNQGALVRYNLLGNNELNGMHIRGETLTTQSVWDDTDITHLVLDQTIYVPDFHTSGGLRLESSATENLIVKLSGDNAGLTATGRELDITDRIGGSLQLVGQPGYPVILTSLFDCTVAAGFTPDGRPLVEANRETCATGQDEIPDAGTGPLQITTVTDDANLLRDTLLGPGVTPVGNATYFGGSMASGIFTAGTTSIGIQDGILLSTGFATDAEGPNISTGSSQVSSGVGDADLDAEFGLMAPQTTMDTTYLEFDFQTDGGDLFFNFVFASEEYNEFVNSAFNDVFAFFVDGVNIAFIPTTMTPVSINTVNGGNPFGTGATNPQFYNNNDPFDGGMFLSEIGYDGFTTVFTAQAMNLGPGVHTIKLAISDVFDDLLDAGVFLQAGSFADRVVGIPATPGDWRSVRFAPGANDRNVAAVTEGETGTVDFSGRNEHPGQAQYLGKLAPREYAGDETLRLGFEVHGSLNHKGDVDVYSFDADQGTEVWLDIDRTTHALDTVVELVDSTGNVLARSDNSGEEAIDPSLIFKGPGLEEGGDANPLNKSPYVSNDLYTTNPRDAGMRVVLPGPVGTNNTYFVRVRSSSDNLANVKGGQTKGAYQLQIRLREIDEVPGSAIHMAAIRFAATGVEVLGGPAHSPLLGEAGEQPDLTGMNSTLDDNNDITTADNVGNLLQSDRGTLGIAGELTQADDIDWYQFEIRYDSIEDSERNEDGTINPQHLATIFDLDYADGLGQANTNLWVFNDAGQLIFIGSDSNVAGDRGIGTDPMLDDLSRGSVGALDPYIGPVALPASDSANNSLGRTYFVAVSSNAQIPAELDQFLTPLANNSLLRVEPINSIGRIAEDRVLSTGQVSTANAPQVPILFGGSGEVTLFAPDGSRLKDGETFTITNAIGNSLTYEFDNGSGVADGNVAIPFDAQFGPAEIAESIATVVNMKQPAFDSDPTLLVAPTATVGQLVGVRAGGDQAYTLVLEVFGLKNQAGVNTQHIFEFVPTGSSTFQPNHIPILLANDGTFLSAEIANAIANEINLLDFVDYAGRGKVVASVSSTPGANPQNPVEQQILLQWMDNPNDDDETVFPVDIRVEGFSASGGARPSPIATLRVEPPNGEQSVVLTSIAASTGAFGSVTLREEVLRRNLLASLSELQPNPVNATDKIVVTTPITRETRQNVAPKVRQAPASGEAQTTVQVSRPAVVPFRLDDVTLFVAEPGVRNPATGGGVRDNRMDLVTVDPFTGQLETRVGVINGDAANGFSVGHIGDLAMLDVVGGAGQMGLQRGLFGLTIDQINPPTDATSGNLLHIDPSVLGGDLDVGIGDDGIETFMEDPLNPGVAVPADVGVLFNALTFTTAESDASQVRGFAIGNRGDFNPATSVSINRQNLLFEINPVDGSVVPPGPFTASIQGSATGPESRGRLATILDAYPANGIVNTLLGEDATAVAATGQTASLIHDGDFFQIDPRDGSPIVRYEFESNLEFNVNVDVVDTADPKVIRDGDSFTVTDENGVTQKFEFETGSVLFVQGGANGNQMIDQFRRSAYTMTVIVEGVNPDGSDAAIEYEFVPTGGVQLSPVTTPLFISAGDNRATIADKIVTRLNDTLGFSQFTNKGRVIAEVLTDPFNPMNRTERITLEWEDRLDALTTEPFPIRVELGFVPPPFAVSPAPLPLTTPALGIFGNTGLVDPSAHPVFVEETFQLATDPPLSSPPAMPREIRQLFIADVIKRTIEKGQNPSTPAADRIAISGVQVGAIGNRLNFLGAADVNFAGVNNRVNMNPTNALLPLFQSVGSQGFQSGSLPIEFLVSDDAATIANRISSIVQTTNTLDGELVNLTLPGATFVCDAAAVAGVQNCPFLTGGAAPSGSLNGMAAIGDQMYAVSDTGGLFRIVDGVTGLAFNPVSTSLDPDSNVLDYADDSQKFLTAVNPAANPASYVAQGLEFRDQVQTGDTITIFERDDKFDKFNIASFFPGGLLEISGSDDNDGTYTISRITGPVRQVDSGGQPTNVVTYTFTLSPGDILVEEDITSNVTLTQTHEPVRFSGLAAGPRHTENGSYENLLFGIAESGRIFAMDTFGRPQAVFANGAFFVETGITEATGLAFSNLVDNLWHTTTRRDVDPGHGTPATFDGSRTSTVGAGNNSFYFGYENSTIQPQFGQGAFAPRVGAGTYDFVGGADGSLLSNPFSLKGYAPEDKPTLYFNYFLDTEEAESGVDATLNNLEEFMRDSFRVYALGSEGEWKLLGTNNSDTAAGDHNDEFDPFEFIDPQSGGTVAEQPFTRAEHFESSGWRQARVDLSPFAGEDFIRLRFDFSTAGGFSSGGANLNYDLRVAGNDLRAVPAVEIRDGEFFTLTDEVPHPLTGVPERVVVAAFEFDAGPTIVAPSGGAIDDGDRFTVGGRTFEFDNNGIVGETNRVRHTRIPFTGKESAAQIATAIEEAFVQIPVTPTTRTGMLTGNEPNDRLTTAVDSGLNGYGEIYTATGIISDNLELDLGDRALDVDLVKLRLDAGDKITVNAMRGTSGSLDTYLRLFDIDGKELAANDDIDPNNPFVTNSRLEFTATDRGTYFVGVSANHNQSYSTVRKTDPVLTGSPSSGSYTLTIAVEDSAVPRRVGNRLNLPNAVNVTSVGLPASFVEGQRGVTPGLPNPFRQFDPTLPPVPVIGIKIDASMTSLHVADQIQSFMAEYFSDGNIDAFKTTDEIVHVVEFGIGTPGPLGLSGPSDVDTALANSGLFGDRFGAFAASTGVDGQISAGFPGAQRMQNNQFEGVYLDDFIIGFASVGEVVTGSVTDNQGNVPPAFVQNTAQPPNEINVGHYQLEIRQAEEFGLSSATANANEPSLSLYRQFDINDRLAKQAAIDVAAGHFFADGQTFKINDGSATVTFEFNDIDDTNGVTSGNVAIAFDPTATDVEMANAIRDAINSSSVQTRLKVRAASADGIATGGASTSNRVNLFGNVTVSVGLAENPAVANQPVEERNDTIHSATNTEIVGGAREGYRAAGVIGDNPALKNLAADVDLFRVELEAGELITIDIDATQNGSPLDSTLRVFDSVGNLVGEANDDAVAPNDTAILINGQPTYLPSGRVNRDPYLTFVAPAAGAYFIAVAGFGNDSFNVFVEGSGTAGSTGFYELEILRPETPNGLEVVQFDARGESNLRRDQGQIVIDSSNISRSAGFGIMVDASQLLPTAQRNLRDVNTSKLSRGVVISNNVLVNNDTGGIDLSGQATAMGIDPTIIPFGRIVNNTIVGTPTGPILPADPNDPTPPTPPNPSGIGIRVRNNMSPSLVNNILSGLETGIEIDATSTSTVIASSLYHFNTNNTSTGNPGDAPLMVDVAVPLFVDPVRGNFYPISGSAVIDTGQDSLEDRDVITQLTGPLGIAPSPILAPQRDGVGLERVDDETATGIGENAFIDRGAIDRSDFVGPRASLLMPLDNGQHDLDGKKGFVNLLRASLTNFSIQLDDSDDIVGGVGMDDSTITGGIVRIVQNGRTLVEGEDYSFSYNRTSNIIRLTPLAGVWDSESNYVITLADRDQHEVMARSGDEIADGDSFDLTDEFGNTETYEYDTGYVIEVPQSYALQIPLVGGGPGGVEDGDLITIDDGVAPFNLEFDSNGFVGSGNTPIPFQSVFSRGEIADAFVAAVQATSLPITPKNAGGGIIHLGVNGSQTVTLTANNITLLGSDVVINDNEFFSIDDGLNHFVFNFVGAGGGGGIGTTISAPFSATRADIAASITMAINSTVPDLSARNLGDGRVHVGGLLKHVLDASMSDLIVTGTPGPRLPFGLRIPAIGGNFSTTLLDDATFTDMFTIDNGQGKAVTFEFDADGTIIDGNVPILLNAPSLNALANSIVFTIRNAGLGLFPQHVGNGIIFLGGDAGYSLDLTNSAVTQVGIAGLNGAVPIPIVPDESFTSGDVAEATAAAINSGSLTGVTAVAEGDEVAIFGATTSAGTAVRFISGARDLAGNALVGEQIDGEARFTVFIGAGLDYGDAPAPYPTLRADNGARHEVLPGFSLGVAIDVDADGVPSPNADGDDLVGNDEDGIFFDPTTPLIPGREYNLTITTSGIGSVVQFGVLDAWIDFNRDGVWGEGNERIFSNLILDETTLTNGQLRVTGLKVPNVNTIGDTYARFRLSTTGGMSPTGPGGPGEVEDYKVTLVANPWQNPVNRFDVNNQDGPSPIDVLLLINYINDNASPVLPLPKPVNAPFLDVNGDGLVSALDVLQLINEINSLNAADVNGEGEGEGDLASLGNLLSANTFDAAALTSDRSDDLFENRQWLALNSPLETQLDTPPLRQSANPLRSNDALLASRLSPRTSNHLSDILADDDEWLDALASERGSDRDVLESVFADWDA